MSEKINSYPNNESTEETQHRQCENCHATVAGMYCSQCGQSIESTLKYFWTVIMHLLDDIFSFDSRASRTLFPLMLKPAFLTSEYIQGRRVHYVPPLRLYLFVSIVFFICLNFFSLTEVSLSNKEEIAQINSQITKFEDHVSQKLKGQKQVEKKQLLIEMKAQIKQFGSSISLKQKSYAKLMIKILNDELDFNQNQKLPEKTLKRLNKNLEVWRSLIENDKELDSGVSFSNNSDGSFTFSWLSNESNAKLDNFTKSIERKTEDSSFETLFKQVISKLPQLMFILLPLFAVLLKILYLFKKRLYLEHLTVALHSHSFIFLSIMLLTLLDAFYDYAEIHIKMLITPVNYLLMILLTWIPIYLFIMQKRIYKQGYFMTFIKFSFIGVLYSLLIAFTFLAAFIWGVTDLPGS